MSSGADPEVLLDFVRSGGQVSLSEWVELPADLRGELAEAGRERDTERAHEFAATLCAHLASAMADAGHERELIAATRRLAAKLEKGEAA